MKGTYLKPMENEKYQIIKKLHEDLKKGANVSVYKNRAASKLNLSRRQINNLLKKYENDGIKGFVHGNRGRLPKITKSYDLSEEVVNLYRTKYFDFNFSHFTEKLKEIEGISISYSCVYSLLTSNGIYSKRIHKRTKKRLKKEKRLLEKEINSTKDYVNQQVELRAEIVSEAHPRRERKKFAGELLQIDASKHKWFGTEYHHLHAAIDDSTGQIVGAYFDKEETLDGYYRMTRQILKNHGIPLKILTDNRTVFEYGKLSNPTLERDTKTQYGFMCQQLGIEVQTTSVPQAKGRIERLFNTLQDRLISEMRIKGIQTKREANNFLDEFLPEFNKKFASQYNNKTSVFEKQLNDDEINRHLAIISKRKIDKGHCISYFGDYYMPTTPYGNDVHFTRGTDVMVIKTLDNQLFMNIEDKLFNIRIVERNERFSENFEVLPAKEKKVYRPPMNHPWKKVSFDAYLAKQKHLDHQDLGAL